MIENVIGRFSLPVGVATNFIVNGREVLVPMVVEEPSIVAGASFMAKLARPAGGFTAEADPPVMIGQVQLLEVGAPGRTAALIRDHRAELLDQLSGVDPVLERLGGGPRDLEVRHLETAVGDMLVVHLTFDVRDAMGANAVNTACERLAPLLEELTSARAGLRILSNLADRRLVRASCTIPAENLAFNDYVGEEVRDRIIEAWAFAEADPYRAATHNKGIMNGIDAVVLATANDWRAVEAGAHAYAAREGRYRSLTRWSAAEDGSLRGELELPLAVGTVGGATRVHPGAQAALSLLKVSTAGELAEVMGAVGLAQNLAALRALATEGIQRGHMALHARQVAIAAGAEGDQIQRVADQLVQEGRIGTERAAEILAEEHEPSS
jgi:hydroxymethylglutaryl-CoA reductase